MIKRGMILVLFSFLLIVPTAIATPKCTNTLGIAEGNKGKVYFGEINKDPAKALASLGKYANDNHDDIVDILGIDFNGDGIDDYAIAQDSDKDNIIILENDGTEINSWSEGKIGYIYETPYFEDLLYENSDYNDVLAKGNFNSNINTEELVCIYRPTQSVSSVAVFENENENPIITLDLPYDAYSVATADIYKDERNIDEIAVGDDKGQVHIYQVMNNELIEKNTLYTERERNVSGIAFGQTDNDDKLEVAVSLSGSASGGNLVFVFQVENQYATYKYARDWGSSRRITSIAMGDVSDNSNFDEVIITTNRGDKADYEVRVWDNTFTTRLGAYGDGWGKSTYADDVQITDKVEGAKLLFSRQTSKNDRVFFTTGEDTNDDKKLETILALEADDYNGDTGTYLTLVSQGSCREVCNDKEDNDYSESTPFGNEGIDCADLVCQEEKGIGPNGEVCALAENTIELCTDGFDNDAQGGTDFDDPNCKSHCPSSAVVDETAFDFIPGAKDGSDGCCGDDDQFKEILLDENDEPLFWHTYTTPKKTLSIERSTDDSFTITKIDDLFVTQNYCTKTNVNKESNMYCRNITSAYLMEESCEDVSSYCSTYYDADSDHPCFNVDGTSNSIPCEQLSSCDDNLCEYAPLAVYSDTFPVGKGQNYLLSGEITTDLIESTGKIIIRIDWIANDGTITHSDEKIKITEDEQFKKIIKSSAGAVKGKIMIIFDGSFNIGSNIEITNLTLLQTGDYGWVSDDHKWRCNYDDSTSTWGWQDATDTPNRFMIQSIGKFDTISNANDFYYCDAENQKVLGTATNPETVVEGHVRMDEWRSPSSGNDGFGYLGVCNLDSSSYYCGDILDIDPTKCLSNVGDCDYVDSDRDGCNNWEEAMICLTDEYDPNDITEGSCSYMNGDGTMVPYNCDPMNDDLPTNLDPNGNSNKYDKTNCGNDNIDNCFSGTINDYKRENSANFAGGDVCENNLDDDDDGFTDCDDADCCQDKNYFDPDNPNNPTLHCFTACNNREYDCDNFNADMTPKDDDNNGKANCDDPFCYRSDPKCKDVNQPINQRKNDSILCFSRIGNSKIAECCSSGECMNDQFVSLNQVDDDNKIFGRGVMTNMVLSGDFYLQNRYIDRIISRTTQDKNHNFYVSAWFRKENHTWKGFKNLEFDLVYENFIEGDTIIFQINYVSGTSEEIDIVPYFTNGNIQKRWHHVKIPITAFTDFTSKNTDYFNIITKREMWIGIDNLHISRNAEKYCTGEFGKWIDSLTPPNNVDPLDYNLYRYTCNSQLSFGWTGTACCGTNTDQYKKEFWDDSSNTGEYHGCFKGFFIKNDRRVNDSLNEKTNFDDLIYSEGKYQSCGNSEEFKNNPGVYTEPSGEEYEIIGKDGNTNTITTNQSNKCAIAGSWFCSHQGYWDKSIPTIDDLQSYTTTDEYALTHFVISENKGDDAVKIQDSPANAGSKIPPGVNLVKNGRFEPQ